MTLAEIRLQLVKDTGRWNLLKADKSTDNGANRIIQAGQRLLDRLQDLPENVGRRVSNLASGEYTITFDNCRAIKKVWVVDSNGDEDDLLKRTMDWMRSNYGDTFSSITNGQPSFYAPNIIRFAPEQYAYVAGDVASMYGVADLLFGADYGYKGLYIMPPADEIYTVHIQGKWYSVVLSEDASESVWSVKHPELLLLASTAILERTLKNWEGLRAIMGGMEIELKGIDFDQVDEEMTDADRIEG